MSCFYHFLLVLFWSVVYLFCYLKVQSRHPPPLFIFCPFLLSSQTYILPPYILCNEQFSHIGVVLKFLAFVRDKVTVTFLVVFLRVSVACHQTPLNACCRFILCPRLQKVCLNGLTQSYNGYPVLDYFFLQCFKYPLPM